MAEDEDEYTFGQQSTDKIVRYVRTRERRALNDNQCWRTNKYMPGGKSVIKWGLSPPGVNPVTFSIGLRLESVPDPDVNYSDPGGVYATGVSSFPLFLMADTWYPLQKMSEFSWRMMVEDMAMFGVYGKLTHYDPDATSPSSGTLTIEEGQGEDGFITAVETMLTIPAINNAKAYCTRYSNVGPNTAIVLIVAQACDPDGG